MAALATDSIMFDSTYATGPFTPESFPGIFAGIRSTDTPYLEESYVLKSIPEDVPTIASGLNNQGYDTIATISNSHLTAKRNFNQGFDVYRNLRVSEDKGLRVSDEGRNRSDTIGDRLSDLQNWLVSREGSSRVLDEMGRLGYTAFRRIQHPDNWPTIDGRVVIDQFLAELSEREQPIFGWTHLMDLHAPLSPAAVRTAPFAPTDSILRMLYWDSIRATDSVANRYDILYDSVLYYVDQLIMRLVDGLKQLGLWEETVLVITGDHGEALFDRGVFGHGQNYLYDEVLNVPLLIRTPQTDGKRVDQPFSLAWLHELIAEVSEIPSLTLPPSDRHSHLDPDAGSDLIISDSINKYGHTMAVRDENNKLLSHFPARNREWPPESMIGPLKDTVVFNTATDPGETIELDSNEFSALKNAAEERATMPDELATLTGQLPDGIKSNLEDLGYVM